MLKVPFTTLTGKTLLRWWSSRIEWSTRWRRSECQCSQGHGSRSRAVLRKSGLGVDLGWKLQRPEYEGDLLGAGIRDGDPVSQVPEITWSATPLITGLWVASTVLRTWAQTTRMSAPTTASSKLHLDDMTLVNGRVGLEGEQWGVYLTANNLLDEDGAFSQQAFLATVAQTPYVCSRSPTALRSISTSRVSSRFGGILRWY